MRPRLFTAVDFTVIRNIHSPALLSTPMLPLLPYSFARTLAIARLRVDLDIFLWRFSTCHGCRISISHLYMSCRTRDDPTNKVKLCYQHTSFGIENHLNFVQFVTEWKIVAISCEQSPSSPQIIQLLRCMFRFVHCSIEDCGWRPRNPGGMRGSCAFVCMDG